MAISSIFLNLNNVFPDLDQFLLNQVLFQVWEEVRSHLLSFANQSETELWQELELAFGSHFDQGKAIALFPYKIS